MSKLEDIVDAKIHAAVTRRLDNLAPTIVAIQQRMNSRGLLHSSVAVTEIHAACISLFDEICDDMKSEYGVLLENILWPTESLADRLISKSIPHFETVAKKAEDAITNAARNLLNSGIHRQLCQDIPLARDRALTDLSLFIDSISKIQTHKKIVRVITWLPKIFMKFIKQ